MDHRKRVFISGYAVISRTQNGQLLGMVRLSLPDAYERIAALVAEGEGQVTIRVEEAEAADASPCRRGMHAGPVAQEFARGANL